jgi:hypothetical protein
MHQMLITGDSVTDYRPQREALWRILFCSTPLACVALCRPERVGGCRTPRTDTKVVVVMLHAPKCWTTGDSSQRGHVPVTEALGDPL